MVEQDYRGLFDFDKTTSSPQPASRSSSIKRGIRPQSHTPISPPPLGRRYNHKTPQHLSSPTKQASLLTSGFGAGGDLGWDWPAEFQQTSNGEVKRPSINHRYGARIFTTSNGLSEHKINTATGQKRPSAATNHKILEPAPKRPKIETDIKTSTMTRNLPSFTNHCSNSTNQPIKEERNVTPLMTAPKKATGPFMVDSDSDDSDEEDAAPKPTSLRISPAISTLHESGSMNLQAQKEAQRLASERLRKEAMDRKSTVATSSNAVDHRHHSGRSHHGVRYDGRDTNAAKKNAQREAVTIDLCSDSEDAVMSIALPDEHEDDWLKGSEVFGVENYDSGDEIVVAGGKKDEGSNPQNGGGPFVKHKLGHDKEKMRLLKERRDRVPISLSGLMARAQHLALGGLGARKLEFFDGIAPGKKTEERKKTSEQAHSLSLNQKSSSISSGSGTNFGDRYRVQREISNKYDDGTMAQVRSDQDATAKTEQERTAQEDRHQQEREPGLAREADERRAGEQRRKERHRREAEEAERTRLDEEKRRAEERRARQQRLVEEYEAREKHKAEEQAKYEKAMAFKKQEAAKAEEQREKDRQALAHWKEKEKQEEMAERATLAKQAERAPIQQSHGQEVDGATKARQERMRAMQERNRRNQQAEDELEPQKPGQDSTFSASNPVISTRGPMSLNSAAGVQRMHAVHSLSVFQPRSDGLSRHNSGAGVQRLRNVQVLPSWEADTSRPRNLNSLADQAAIGKSSSGGATPASATASFDSGYGSNAQRSSDKRPSTVPSITNANLTNQPTAEPQVNHPKLRAQVGEVLPEDIKMVEWRDRGATWSQVIAEIEHLTGKVRGEDYLRRRCKLVTEVLKQIVLDEDILDLAKKGDRNACEALNRAIHGTWPLPPTATTSSFVLNDMYDTVLDDPKFKKKLGEVVPEDIKIYQWREMGGQWSDIAYNYEEITGVAKDSSTIKRRYEFIAEALKAVNVTKDELNKLANGNMEARERVNRAIHGRWPIHAAMHIDTSKPHFLKKLGEITGGDVTVIKLRDSGMTWEQVSDQFYGLSGQRKDKGGLRLRYEHVTAALGDHPELEQNLLDRLIGDKDESAREEVNRAVHGAWPIPKLSAVPGSLARNGSKTRTGSLASRGPARKPSNASLVGLGQKLARDVTETDCKLLSWRDYSRMTFQEIGETLRERPKALESRYNNLKATLDNVPGVDQELIRAVAVGDEDAKQSLNFLVQMHGTSTEDDNGERTSLSSDHPDSATLAGSPLPAARSDGRPSVGGKSLNLVMLLERQNWLEAQDEAEADEPKTADRADSPLQPDDYCHMIYFVQRRELKFGEINEEGEEVNIEDVPWIMCGNVYETLTGANMAAIKQVGRAHDPELKEAFAQRREANTEEKEDVATGLLSLARAVPEGRVEVRACRQARTFKEGIPPTSKKGWLNRTGWKILERRITTETSNGTADGDDDDDADGLFSETVTKRHDIEHDVEGITYTLAEMANKDAVEHWLKLTWSSSTPNLDARKAAREEARQEYLDELEASGENAHFVTEDGTIEVKVVTSPIRGPRNILV